MIQTMSQYYYGHTISTVNNWIDFKEGAGPEISAEFDVGEYSLTDFVTEGARVLNGAGGQTYTVSVDRTTRIITVSAPGPFTFLASSGTNFGRGVWPLIGFSADTSSATSHVATSASGYSWRPQYMGQSFVDFLDQQSAIDGVTRVSANGIVEAVKFGTKNIMDVNWKFITNYNQPSGSPVENQANAESNARDFMLYAITKADLEFMPDRDDPDTFTKCLLEATVEDGNGLGFKLKELYDQGLVGYWETGLLKFRKL